MFENFRIKFKKIKTLRPEPYAPDDWSDTKFAEWKNFWDSPMGKVALSKMEQLRRANLDATADLAKKGATADIIAHYASISAGIDIVIQDIQQGVTIAENRRKNTPKEVSKSDSE